MKKDSVGFLQRTTQIFNNNLSTANNQNMAKNNPIIGQQNVIQPNVIQEKTNIKDKRFACNYTGCNYTAIYNNHLQVHIKAIHEKIKDFSCNDCDYKSSYKQHMRTHVMRVHANKNGTEGANMEQ